MEEIPEHLAK